MAFSARYGMAERAERALQRRQRGARREQHGDVARAARPDVARAVADGPALAQRRGDGAGDGRRLAPAQLVGVDVVAAVLVGAEHADRAVLARLGPAGVERSVRRLDERLGLDHRAEHAVDPVDDGGAGAEVGRQRGRRGVELGGRGEVGRDVRPPEAVDRLLGVADDEQPAGDRPQPRDVVARLAVGRRGQAHGDLELDRIGVLELVEEHPLVAIVQVAAGRRVGRQQAPGEHEEVVELERAGRGPRRGGVEHEASAHHADDRLAVAPPLAEVGIDDAGDGDLLGAQRVEGLAPAVVRASCPCCRCARAWRGDRGSPPARPAPGRCRR